MVKNSPVPQSRAIRKYGPQRNEFILSTQLFKISAKFVGIFLTFVIDLDLRSIFEKI